MSLQPRYETNLDKALALARTAPGTLLKVLWRKAVARLMPMPALPARKRINGVLVTFEDEWEHLGDEHRSFTRRMIKDMYYQSYEVLTVETMRRYLRPGATFVDVGACTGYLTAQAAGMVGRAGAVHCFEPVPYYVQFIRRLAAHNPAYHIVVNGYAVGERAGVARIEVDRQMISGSSLVKPPVAEAAAAPRAGGRLFDVGVVPLDAYLAARNLSALDLIHIEVEGFELHVLKGMQTFLSSTDQLPPIICAVFPHYYPHNGYTLEDLAAFVDRFPYRVSTLSAPGVPINLANLTAHTLVLLQPLPRT